MTRFGLGMLALLVGCRASAPVSAARAQEQVSGAYELAVCSSAPCSAQNGSLSGTVVLFEGDPRLPEALDKFMLGAKSNGCFASRPLGAPPEPGSWSILHEVPAASLIWVRQEDGQITFSLYEASYGRYVVSARLLNGEFAGSAQWVTGHPPSTPSVFVARRLAGLPEVRTCTRGQRGFEDVP